MARNDNRASTLRRLHRTVGLVGAAFILFITTSGIVINHSNAFGLAARQVSHTLLLDWYGLEGPEQLVSYRAGDDWLSFAGAQLYVNGTPVATLADGVGVARTSGMIIAAGRRELILLDEKARLIERVAWTGAGLIEALGLDGDTIVARAGGRTWVADEHLLGWSALETLSPGTRWSMAETAPAEITERVNGAYRGNGLSLQQVLLDMHSGRFFGSAGVWVYDLLALLLGFLAVSGLVLWSRSRRKLRRHRPSRR